MWFVHIQEGKENLRERTKNKKCEVFDVRLNVSVFHSFPLDYLLSKNLHIFRKYLMDDRGLETFISFHKLYLQNAVYIMFHTYSLYFTVHLLNTVKRRLISKFPLSLFQPVIFRIRTSRRVKYGDFGS